MSRARETYNRHKEPIHVGGWAALLLSVLSGHFVTHDDLTAIRADVQAVQAGQRKQAAVLAAIEARDTAQDHLIAAALTERDAGAANSGN